MFQFLDRPTIVQIPDDHLHVGACSQQIVFIWLLWAPANVENVHLVPIFEFFVRLYPFGSALIEESRGAALRIIHREQLVDP